MTSSPRWPISAAAAIVNASVQVGARAATGTWKKTSNQPQMTSVNVAAGPASQATGLPAVPGCTGPGPAR
jgi:hypothetical protein